MAPGVVVSKPIDQTNLGMTAQNGGNIYDGHALYVDGRNNFERAQDWLDFWRNVRLKCSHDHVLAALLASPRFIEHAERLADARGVAQKYFQPSPSGLRCCIG